MVKKIKKEILMVVSHRKVYGTGKSYGMKRQSQRNKVFVLFCFVFKIYLFIHERRRERGRDIDRGKSRLLARGPDAVTRSQDPKVMT